MYAEANMQIIIIDAEYTLYCVNSVLYNTSNSHSLSLFEFIHIKLNTSHNMASALPFKEFTALPINAVDAFATMATQRPHSLTIPTKLGHQSVDRL